MIIDSRLIAQFTIAMAIIFCSPFISMAQSPATLAIYKGEITRQKNQQFFLKYQAQAIGGLLLNSDGGEVEAAIALARWVDRLKLDVVIDGYCLSSCANYVFAAGNRKIIKPGAIVAWHGNYHHLKATGKWQSEIPQRMKKYKQDYVTAYNTILSQVNRLVKLERDFFRQIKVDEYVCWVGKMAPFNALDFYTMSKKDMQSFGLLKIDALIDYPHNSLPDKHYNIVSIQLGR